MKKLKQIVVVAIVVSMVFGSVAGLKSFNTNKGNDLIGFDTYSTMNHDPDPLKS